MDPGAETAVREEWLALHAAGLPTELRLRADASHRPHVTLFAGPSISVGTDAGLSRLVSGLALRVEIGALMLFGPHRERFVLVHQVVPTAELLELQAAVAEACGADPGGHFGPGRWSPHVSIARRVVAPQLPELLSTLASRSAVGSRAEITGCRRWDSEVRRTWLL